MTMRAPRGEPAYWAKWVAFGEESIGLGWDTASKPFGDPSYAPQYLFELAQDHWHQILRRYSAGLPVQTLPSYFPGLLDAWERSQALGDKRWSVDERFTRNAWRVNHDHYITCFWVVGLALALEIPGDQWQRLVSLVGNEGEDSLLDRVIATRSPQRRIGEELLYPKPYGRLLAAIVAPVEQQAGLLRNFVDHWYDEVGNGARSGKYQQAAAFKHPYWYRYGDDNFGGGAYFGRWCVEAAAAVKAFGLDDQRCLGHEHYPQALLHDEPDALPASSGQGEKRSFWSRLFGSRGV